MKLTVFGVPAPQGSKRHVGNGVMIESSKNVGAWRRQISAAANAWLALNGMPKPEDGPVEFIVTFYMPRPKSAPKRVKYPTGRPDGSKLLRAVEDALTKIIYTDDSRIVDIHVFKRFAIDSPPRAEIEVRRKVDEAA